MGTVAFTFKHQIQPWHPQSTLLHEAALAVQQLGGEEAFWKFSTALFTRQLEFFDDVCYSETRDQIYARLVEVAVSSCGVDGAALAALLALDSDESKGHNRGNAMAQPLKMCIKEGRQSGIHVSPTCLVNGIVFDTSSSWGLEQWTEFLAPLLPKA